jgi:hypothetical protein
LWQLNYIPGIFDGWNQIAGTTLFNCTIFNDFLIFGVYKPVFGLPTFGLPKRLL